MEKNCLIFSKQFKMLENIAPSVATGVPDIAPTKVVFYDIHGLEAFGCWSRQIVPVLCV